MFLILSSEKYQNIPIRCPLWLGLEKRISTELSFESIEFAQVR